MLDQSDAGAETIFIAYLHLLQAELMKRCRLYLAEHQTEHSPVDHALMVSIAGIAGRVKQYRLII